LQGYFSPLHRFLSGLPADNGELYERLLAGAILAKDEPGPALGQR